MADAKEYAEWLVSNKDKRGSTEFETVAAAYRKAREAESVVANSSLVREQPSALARANPMNWTNTPTEKLEAVKELGPAAVELAKSAAIRGGPAAAGAAIGSMVKPGLGTAAGAGIGALVGSVTDQYRTRGEVRAGETIADTAMSVAFPGSAAARAPAQLAKRAALEGIVNIEAGAMQTLIDEGRLPSGGEMALYGAGGFGGVMLGGRAGVAAEAAGARKLLLSPEQAKRMENRSLMHKKAARLIGEGGSLDPATFGQNPVQRSLASQAEVRRLVLEDNNAWGRGKLRTELGLGGNGPLTSDTVDAVVDRAMAPYQAVASISTTAADTLSQVKANQQRLTNLWRDYREGRGIREEIKKQIDSLNGDLERQWDLLSFEAASVQKPEIKGKLEQFYEFKNKADKLEAEFNAREQLAKERSGNPNYRPRTIGEFLNEFQKTEFDVTDAGDATARAETVFDVASALEWKRARQVANSAFLRMEQQVKDTPEMIAELNNARRIIAQGRLLQDLGVVERGGSGFINMTPLGDYYSQWGKDLTGGFKDVADMANTFGPQMANPMNLMPSGPGKVSSLAAGNAAAHGNAAGALAAGVPYLSPYFARRVTSRGSQGAMIEAMNRGPGGIDMPDLVANFIRTSAEQQARDKADTAISSYMERIQPKRRTLPSHMINPALFSSLAR